LTQIERPLSPPALESRASARLASARLADFVQLTKPGVTRMVTITAAVGFGMGWIAGDGADRGPLALLAVATVIGTALAASGAAALNEWWERDRDALMQRTADRPIPAGRLSAGHGLAAGLALSVAGVAVLWAFANWAAAAVALATIVSYVAVYTPLKPVTPLATLVGAIPGALPPLIGWTAASSAGPRGLYGLDAPGGWGLFLLIAVWQIPHFLAIAWMYREDYARGGYKTLPVVDEDGMRTGATALMWSVALAPASLFPMAAMPGRLGWGYVIPATVLAAGFVGMAWRLAVRRTTGAARGLFFASIIYLPLALAAMVADAAARAFL
jgi:protoheme IX farnesyltransferase